MELGAFKDYESEFLQRSSPLSSQINGLLSQPDDAASSSSLKTIEQEIQSAQKTLRYMDLEVRGLSEPMRSQLGSKVKTYQESFARVTADFKRAQEKVQRASLMGPGRTDSNGRPLEFGKSLDARLQMEQSTSKLQGASSVLDSAHSRLEETIGVASGTMEELGRNRETINRVQGNLTQMHSLMDDARRIVSSMMKREMRTRIVVALFAIVLIGIIIGLIVWMSSNNSSN